MLKNLLLPTLVLTVTGAVVHAQPANGIPGLPAAPIQVNEAHEKVKKEAERAYQNADFDKVSQLTSRIIRENPKDHVALYLRGSAKVEQGVRTRNAAKIREGIADCRNSILHGPDDESMYYLPYLYGMSNLTVIEGRNQHAGVATQVATQTLQNKNIKGEDRANLLYQRAFSKQVAEDYDGAVKDYKAAIEEFPAHLGSHVAMAEVQVKAGDKAAAEKAFAAALETFPNSPLIFNNRGMYYQQQGQHEKAIDDFTSALKQDPSYFTSYTNRGFSLMKTGNLSAAVIDFNESLKRNSKQTEVYRLRASANLAQGKAEEAIGDYREIIKLNPQNATARAELGFAQFFASQHQSAFDSFSGAQRMDSDLRYVDPWRYLALAHMGQEAKAKTLFSDSINKIAVQRDWIDALIAYQAGTIGMADVQAAMVTDDPDMRASQQTEIDFFTAHRMLKEGEGARAREHFQKAINSGKEHLSAYRGARYALKQFETAASTNETPE